MNLLHAAQGMFLPLGAWYNFVRVKTAVTHAAIC